MRKKGKGNSYVAIACDIKEADGLMDRSKRTEYTINSSFIDTIKAATAAGHNKGISFVEIDVDSDAASDDGDLGDGGEGGAGEGEGEEEVHNDDDEPHLVDKGAGDEYDPSAPAMHVPAREEYDERECFGAGSEEEGRF